MLSVHEAIERARNFMEEVYGVPATGTFQLEEVEKTDDGQHWFVTFSFLKKDVSPLATDMLVRQYKVVKIDAETGAPIAIKMREVA